MKVAIITDSSCNLPKEYINKVENLTIVPLSISINDQQYRDQVEISSAEVYSKIDTHTIKTSLPSLADITLAIEDAFEEGYEQVLFLTISSGLSGTFNAVRLAIEDMEGDITVYDTKTLSMAQGFLVMDAVRLINEEGKTVEETITLLDDLRKNKLMASFTIDTLKYLRAGGRIGKVEGTIADILKIKPIIYVNEDGVYDTLAKARGSRRAISKTIEAMVDRFGDKKINLAIHYGDNLDKATMLLERLKERLNVQDSILIEITPVLGIHTGPSMIATIVQEVWEEVYTVHFSFEDK